MAKKPTKKLSSITDLRSKYGRPETEYRPSGILELDEQWGGGVPSGKVIELHSDAGLGKTTIFLQVAKRLMQDGIRIGFLDVEQALDISLIRSMKMEHFMEAEPGTMIPMLSVFSPATYDEVQDCMDTLLDADITHVIFDSLTMTAPDRVEGRKFSEEDPGLKSRMQAKFLERYKAAIARKQGNLFLVNQMRANLSSFMGGQTPAGGAALRFYTDIRTGMKRLRWAQKTVKGEKTNIGAELQITTIKNKVAPPFRTSNVTLEFGKGINPFISMAELLLRREIVTLDGGHYTVPGVDGTIYGRGRFDKWVKENYEACCNELLDGTITEDTSDNAGGENV